MDEMEQTFSLAYGYGDTVLCQNFEWKDNKTMQEQYLKVDWTEHDK